jgi:hypothetical protein
MGCELWSLALSKELKLKLFENMGPWRMFVAKRGEWRELHIGELHDLYSFPNITRVIKSRMRWVGHLARMGGERRELFAGFWWGNLGKRDNLGNRDVSGG